MQGGAHQRFCLQERLERTNKLKHSDSSSSLKGQKSNASSRSASMTAKRSALSQAGRSTPAPQVGLLLNDSMPVRLLPAMARLLACAARQGMWALRRGVLAAQASMSSLASGAAPRQRSESSATGSASRATDSGGAERGPRERWALARSVLLAANGFQKAGRTRRQRLSASGLPPRLPDPYMGQGSAI